MKTIGIIGSRRRDTQDDHLAIVNAFNKFYEYGDTIVSGGCKQGGDLFAEIIAKLYDAPIIIHYPDKTKLDPALMSKSPRVAYAQINYARNTLVAKDSDVLIACVAKDRKGGTEDTIKKYIKFKGFSWLILV